MGARRHGADQRPTTPGRRSPDLSDDEVLARLHFRVGAEARRRGDDATARRHFERAGELAPMDFTIRRAAMPLLGGDPFGPEFMELFARSGRPPAARSTGSRR